jgi:hypothetical protein
VPEEAESQVCRRSVRLAASWHDGHPAYQIVLSLLTDCPCRVNFSQSLYVLGNIFLLLVSANAVTYPLLLAFLRAALAIPMLTSVLNLGGCGLRGVTNACPLVCP